jgi:hypothetical protein
MPSRRNWFVVASFIAAAVSVSTIVAVGRAPRGFTRFELPTPPQRAFGDFDGDGRLDIAVIRHDLGGRGVSIELSGSPVPIQLDAPVTGVVEDDVDHDGDLDLVAATASGDLLIWINDGHGRFERQLISEGHNISSGPSLVGLTTYALAGTAPRPTSCPSPDRATPDDLVHHVRAPAAVTARRTPGLQLPPLRAPPASRA